MEKVLEIEHVKEFKEELDKFPQLAIIEEKTGVPRLYVVGGAGIVLFLGMLGAFGGSPVSNLVGFVYPTYKSYKALQSEKKEDDTQWLTYWVVYSFFIVVEGFTDLLISWIPFYYLAKIAFLCFCMSSKTKGSTYIFENFIEPFLDKASKNVDELEEDIKDAVEDFAEDVREDLTEKGTKFVAEMMVNRAKGRQSPNEGESPQTSPEASDGDDYDDPRHGQVPSYSDSDDAYHPKSK